MKKFKATTELPEKFYDFIMNCDQITDKDKGLSIAERLWNKELLRAVHSKTSFPLSSKYKKMLIRDNNCYHYFTLIQENIFEVIRDYSVKGKRCKYVRMRQEFSQSPTIKIEFLMPKRRKRSVQGYDESIELKLDHLCEGLSLKIESGGSVETIVRNNYLSIEEKVKSKFIIKSGNICYKGRKIPRVEDIDELVRKHIEYTMKHHKGALYRLSSGNFNLPSRNSTNQRLDYILTSLSKDYLPFVRYKDECLCEIDMSCCQPTLFANLIGVKKDNQTSKEVKERVNSLGNIYIPLLFSENLNIELTDDLELFMERCFSGTLYDHREGFRDRDHFKKFIMRIFFDIPKSLRSTEEYNNIMRMYPYLLKIINNSKGKLAKEYSSYPRVSGKKNKIMVRRKERTPAKAGCNEFAVILQKYESDLFISLALKSLLDKGYPVFPKHDSFLVPESYADKVLEELNHIFRDALGGDYFKLRVKQIASKNSEDFPSNIQAA